MSKDPFGSDSYLDLDFDTSYEDSESWQGALKTEEDPDRLVHERTGSRSRVRFFYGAAAAVFCLLLGRLMILQIVNWDQNKALAEGNRIRETDIRAPRGVIYDAKHQIIARNIPNVEVAVTPVELPRKPEDRQATYQVLADILKKSVPEVQQAAEAKGTRYGQQVVIADKLDRDTSMLAKVKTVGLSGVTVSENPQRQYDRTEEYAHLVGYTGRVSDEDLKRNDQLQSSDYVGKTGLERVYEDELRGTSGKRRVEVNAQGEAIKELASTEPVSGKNVILGIDPDLQTTMYKAVENGIKSSRHKATGGSAIALNPKTGEVLGMVSAPSFDNNLFVNGIASDKYNELSTDERKPLFNRPVSGEYPPGSTFKLITATGALAEGVVNPNTTVASPPFIEVGGSKFVDWKESGHGSVNAAKALAVSSDVFFYTVGGGFKNQKGIGEDKLAEYMRQYGLGKQTGIDLPEERTGLVPSPQYKEETFNEPWYIGNTYQMAIGQGYVLATPLQVADYTAAVANGGVAYKPHLVKAFENPENPADVTTVKPEPVINLKVDKEVIQTVQEGMRQAVQSGTAQELNSLPVDICGKTGSAEFANETNAHAWFTAYAPCNDPQIVVTVMIEGGGEGADVAVPAAKTILTQFFHLTDGKYKPATVQ
jgi:penicillin-binding protein 2